MPYQLDAKSIKILRKLYKKPMADVKYKALLGWTDDSQLNEVDSFLRREGLVKSIIVDGVKDGAGGYIDGTVVRRYEITHSGKTAVEQNQSAGMAVAWNCLKDFLQTIFPFLPL